MVRESFNNIPSSVLVAIKAAEQAIYQGGAVDVEKDQVESIMTRMNNHQISPEDALNELNLIVAKRQDYH